jgi:PAS domain-containing protein
MRHQHSVADSSLEPLSGSPHVIDLDLLDLLPCTAAIWALKEDTATLNPQAQQLFAVVNGEEATVTAWTDQIHPQDRSIFTVSRRELLSGLKRAGCDYRFFPNGQRQAIWLREISTIQPARHGKPGGVLSVYTDISDLKKDGLVGKINGTRRRRQ